jgi:hypothetical protein
LPTDTPKVTGISSPDTGVSSPITARSPITKGKALSVAGGDLRGPWARRMRDLMDLHLSDLGGPGAVSQAEASIVRRASTIEVELERLEAKFSSGEASPTDLDLYQRAAGNLRRLLESVGLQRRSRDVTPSLTQYIAQRYGQDAEVEDEGGQ